MPTHLYCLLPAASDCAPPGDDGAIRALVVGEVVAWVSTTPNEKLTRDARTAAGLVIEHDRGVAQALARGVTRVPAPLAAPYPSDDAAGEDIPRRSGEITESWGRIAGGVKMPVVLAARPDGGGVDRPAGQSPGRA